MSKRTERREAERTARKLAYQQPRQQPASAPSPAQLEANRANAQLSTGPVTTEGKAISSRNNTRHGLAGSSEVEDFQVLGNENQHAYDQSLAAYRAEWKPTTATEHDLVNRMVMHRWLRRRALRLQEALFSNETGEISDTKKFELYRRYETSHERGYNKALADMLRLRSFQLRQHNGFESQRRKNEEHEFKMRRLTSQQNRKTPLPMAIARPETTSASPACELADAAVPA